MTGALPPVAAGSGDWPVTSMFWANCLAVIVGREPTAPKLGWVSSTTTIWKVIVVEVPRGLRARRVTVKVPVSVGVPPRMRVAESSVIPAGAFSSV